jgi:hypothetical protein
MNLNDLYEMRDSRDAYERDAANSTGGFGKDSQAYRADGGANDENHALDQQSSTWYIRLNGKLIKDKSGNPYAFQDKAAANKAAQTMQAKLFNKDKEFMLTTNPNDKVAEIVDYDTLNQLASHPMAGPLVAAGGAAIGGAIGGGIKKTVDYFQKRKEQKAQAQRLGQQGMAEGEQRVDSLVTDALKVMRGARLNDAVQALKTVLGDREYNDRRGHYNFYIKQLVDMYGQQSVTESNEYSAVAGAITRRIITQHPEVLAKYGPAVVGQAIDEVAEFAGDVDEIGSSDVSGWVSQVIRSLGRFAPVRDEGVAEGAENRHRFIRHNIWTVMDGDEEVMQHTVEGDPFFSAKKFMRDLDDEGYEFTHVISPEGKVSYLPQFDPRNFPKDEVDESDVDSNGHSVDHADSGEYDYEGDQARDQMNTIVRAARRLDGLLDDNENMPEWVQMKVTLAADYLDTAADYIESNQEPELDEGERGRGRPPSGEQDTTPVTPGRVEKTATGIRHHADPSRYGGTEPDNDEDDHLMSKSHISRLGKMTEPDIDEGEKVGNMDADKFDSAMARLKQLAGAGPMKTVYDPTKRVYRNVPTAVQPKK